MAITIAGDIYTVAECAKTQGYLASVWAVSSVVGPTLGGVFSEFLSWRWIFFVNVPLCLIAGWMLVRHFQEKVERRTHTVDYAGAVLLTLGLSAVILAVLEGGQAWAWSSPQSIVTFTAGGLLLLHSSSLSDAPPNLSCRSGIHPRLLLTTTFISLGVGAILIGLTSYVPTYLEGALGVSPLVSGLALAALTLGWPISASVSGRFYLRIGFQRTVLIGLAVAIAGAAVLAVFASSPHLAVVTVGCFVVGLGMGLVASPSLIAAQSSARWNERGMVTGTNMFARSIGSAVVVAIFGAIANAVFAASDASPGGRHEASVVIQAGGAVFIAVLVCAVLTVIAGLAMPRSRVEDVELRAGALLPES
jgi:MFS family permease